MAVFIPTKRPAESKRGPPEFPVPGSGGGLTANAVCWSFYVRGKTLQRSLTGAQCLPGGYKRGGQAGQPPASNRSFTPSLSSATA